MPVIHAGLASQSGAGTGYHRYATTSQMHETMIERLIGVLKQGPGTNGDDPSATAIAVLEAMREPGAGMAEAGAEVIPGEDPANHVEVANDVWRAMIGEAIVRDFAKGTEPAAMEDASQPETGPSYDDEDMPL
jgi:hypothetical protein